MPPLDGSKSSHVVGSSNKRESKSSVYRVNHDYLCPDLDSFFLL